MTSVQDWLRRAYHLLPRPPSTNFALPGHQHPDPLSGLEKGSVVYDIGSKRVREYGGWRTPPDVRIVRVDIDPDTQPDIVADAHDLFMIQDGAADAVICVCVLEHCAKPTVVMSEIYRILKPGGRLFIGIPFMFPYHADPHDHWRCSYTGVKHLCEDFEEIGSGFLRGPASCMSHLCVHFSALMFSFNNKFIYGLMIDFFGWILFWIKYFDLILYKHPMRHVIHAGVWYYGRRPLALREHH